MVSAGGEAAPAPTAPPGGLRVDYAGQTLAYGAILYDLPAKAVTATLTLRLADVVGTPQLEACPTKSTSWKAGGDQSADKAPAYDCKAAHFLGAVASDNSTVTFEVTPDHQPKAGELSLAIVPGPGSTTPYSVDVARPGNRALTVSTAPQGPPPGSATGQPPASAPGTAGHQTAAGGQAPSAGGNPQPGAAAAGQPLGLPVPAHSGSNQLVKPGPGSAPQVAPQSSSPGTAAQPNSTANSDAASVSATPRIASAVGAIALATALLMWGFGFGLLGGRIVPLSRPLSGGPASSAGSG